MIGQVPENLGDLSGTRVPKALERYMEVNPRTEKGEKRRRKVHKNTKEHKSDTCKKYP